MTEENFNYRTNPLFLRNEFNSKGKWKIPIIPKCNSEIISNEDLRVIGFDQVKNNKDTHYNRLVHFFLYDYEFEKIWEKPQKYVDILKKYRGVLSPDFSMYIEMNPVMQLYNTFRNRWIGAYLASQGINVIPRLHQVYKKRFLCPREIVGINHILFRNQFHNIGKDIHVENIKHFICFLRTLERM